VKQLLARSVNSYLAPLRQRRERYYEDPKALAAAVRRGTDAAASEARRTLAEVYDKMGLRRPG
jgi:tryptophanyl-tRNA synthetase